MDAELSLPTGQIQGPLDPRQFGDMYDQTLPVIYGYFVHRCGGRVSVAEDLTQETFLAAISQLRGGTVVERPLPWLYGIARHKLLDHYRRDAREARPQLVESDDQSLNEDDEAWRQRAVEALSRVAPDQRAALVLRHMDGLSVPEVAGALGRSVEAAESLLSRGRAAFRSAYEDGHS